MTEISPTRRFFGGLLMVVGGLIAGLCGLCSGFFQIASVYDLLTTPTNHGVIFGTDFLKGVAFLPIPLGIVPILIGLGLFFWGRRLLRGEAPK